MICPVAHLHWVVVFPSFWGSWVELLKMFTNYCTFDPLFFIIWEHCQHQLLRTVTAPEKASDNTDGGSLNANVCFGTKSCWWPIQHCILWIGQWWPCEKHEWYLVVTSQTKNSSSDSNLITVHVSRCFLFQSLLLSGGASLNTADPAQGAAWSSEGWTHAVPPVFGGRGRCRFSYLQPHVSSVSLQLLPQLLLCQFVHI